MSAVSDFLTEPSFWWGGLAGTLITGVIAPLITARSLRNSDTRKAAHDAKMQALKETREDKVRGQETLRETANEFSAVCSAVIEKAIDSKGVFNSVLDAVQNME